MASKVKLVDGVVKNESLDDGNSVGDASPRVNHKTVSATIMSGTRWEL